MADAAMAPCLRCDVLRAKRESFESGYRRLSQYPSLSRIWPCCIAREADWKRQNFHEIVFEIRMSSWQRGDGLSSFRAAYAQSALHRSSPLRRVFRLFSKSAIYSKVTP
jgi:hypothetical protein